MSDVEIRLRISLDEAHAVQRLLKGRAAEPGDDDLLNRVSVHVGAVIGTVTKHHLEPA